MTAPPASFRRTARLLAAALLLAAGIGGGIFGYVHFSRLKAESADGETVTSQRKAASDSVELPERTAELARIQTTAVRVSDKPRELRLRGSLALDPNRLVHVHARFPGQIVQLAGIDETLPGSDKVIPRPLSFMDRVTKGQDMAVLWSKDLGEKKSELVDLLARLRLDKQILARRRKAAETGSISESSVREAERQVEVGEIAVSRVERTLRSWMLTDAEIEAVRDEAERAPQHDARSTDRDDSWARLDMTAPIDGTIVEKNVTVGDIVDTSADLFKIADLSSLNVWLHAYEEDLPYLQQLPRPIPARLTLPSSPELPPIEAQIERIGEIIDPNEHMALLIGSVANPSGELRAGQFVTATIQIPPEQGVVEIPTKALVDDGDESFVFVQPDAGVAQFTRRRVAVTRRYHDVVYVRSEPDEAERKLGIQSLHAGQRVVSSGALQLEETFSRQNSGAEAEQKSG